MKNGRNESSELNLDHLYTYLGEELFFITHYSFTFGVFKKRHLDERTNKKIYSHLDYYPCFYVAVLPDSESFREYSIS